MNGAPIIAPGRRNDTSGPGRTPTTASLPGALSFVGALVGAARRLARLVTRAPQLHHRPTNNSIGRALLASVFCIINGPTGRPALAVGRTLRVERPAPANTRPAPDQDHTSPRQATAPMSGRAAGRPIRAIARAPGENSRRPPARAAHSISAGCERTSSFGGAQLATLLGRNLQPPRVGRN